MRRWLTIFLLVFLPLQFTWTAAAAYCQHEQESGIGHFGHHEHKHAASTASNGDAASDAANGNDNDAPAPGAEHTDCAFCHLSLAKSFGTLAIALPAPVMALPASGPPAAVDAWLSERIDRPNWHRG